MGCDIHLYMEYRSKKNANDTESLMRDYWWNFGKDFNPGRDYILFGAIAGVRYEEIGAVVEPKGIPDTLGWPTGGDFYLRIDVDSLEDNWELEEKTITLKSAEEYAKYGSKIIYDQETNVPKYVEHPDWHTPTWLTVEEFESAIQKTEAYYRSPENIYKYRFSVDGQYQALLAAAKALQSSDNEVRFVIWFDN
jgi:hypothetical protein